MMPRPLPLLLLIGLAAACGRGPMPRSAPAPVGGGPPVAAPRDATAATAAEPVLPPPVAFVAGLLPLHSTGVPEFLRTRPTYDGRGVLIAILDSGIDPGVPGLIATSTGAPKVLDLRDFSGEGRVPLMPVRPVAGTILVAGRALVGAGRIARLAAQPQWYAGVLRELPLGNAPAADLNGNGDNTDEFPLVVARVTDGWAVFLDTNLDGSFEDEMPLHDYRQGRETLTLGRQPITLAANFQEVDGAPVLDLLFDTSGHGTHVAGIAAGHNLYGVAGFHGVAPGAQVIGLKIANNARGGITVHGSMARAMAYAARFARERGLPLVLNLSFGVGNEREGRAVIDSLVNAFLVAHPEVVFVISAGNDGPGLSTMGLPGSADLAFTVGATFPGVFVQPPEPGRAPAADVPGPWSARGGELAKPDLLAPGVAFSTVPRWNTGDEVKLGTSMAAPHVAGLAACLLSAMAQESRPVSGSDITQALRASAQAFGGATVLDQGAGMPRLPAAYDWLMAGHQGSEYLIRTRSGTSAAFRRGGLGGAGDTLDVYHVIHATGRRAAQYLLRPDVPWLSAPRLVDAAPGGTEITVVRKGPPPDAPGAYVGSVLALNPSDTLAGPLFRLVSTVVVPHDLTGKPLVDERRFVGAARVQRYFLRAPVPEATLEITVTLPDSAKQSATVHLYEPTGQPFRGGGELAIGEHEPGTARVRVRGEDLVPGVYELDVVAPPTTGVRATVRAQLDPVALAVRGSALEATNVRAGTVRGRLSTMLVGAARHYAMAGRGAPAETLVVRVPAWAATAEVHVALPRDRWDEFTDFGVTVFDSLGRQVAQHPLNYAVGRERIELNPELVGRLLLVELFPAYAWTERTPPWQATVTLTFLLAEPRSLARADLTVVGGGRVRVPLPDTRGLVVPPGFTPLLEASLGGATRRIPLGLDR